MKTKHSSKAERYAEEIGKRFISDRISHAYSFGDGHINDTFCLVTDKESYICQRIRGKIDTGILEHNYLLYSELFEKADLLYPRWLKASENSFFYNDANGDRWRVYKMIGGETAVLPLDKDMCFACGKGLAGFHLILQKLKEKPLATYPMLHDLDHYYDRYLRVLDHGLSGEARDAEVEKYISSRIQDFLDIRTDRSAVIHGDPKLANILFEDGRIKAFIDLDTIMQGSLLEDIADCVRSCCVKEGKIDEDLMQAFLRGYQSEENGLIGKEELSLLPRMISKIRFELGLRYYTDSIAKEKSFKEKYPGYLLEKARNNLALL